MFNVNNTPPGAAQQEACDEAGYRQNNLQPGRQKAPMRQRAGFRRDSLTQKPVDIPHFNAGVSQK